MDQFFHVISHDIWRSHQFIGTLIVSALISIHVGRGLSWLLGIILFYCLGSALFVFNCPYLYYGQAYAVTGVSASKAFAAVILPVFLVGMLNQNTKKAAFFAIEALAVFDSALVIAYGFGLFNNGSMDATFIAMTYISIASRPDHPGYRRATLSEGLYYFLAAVLPLVAIFMAKGTASYIVLAASIGAFLFAKKRYFLCWIGSALTVGIGIYSIKSLYFFQPNGRFKEWHMQMLWWKEHANIWLGTGAGSFEIIGPAVDMLYDGRKSSLFLFMHNDYLQALFEFGIVGFSLFMTLLGVCLWKTRNKPWIFASVVALAVAGSMQFPFRFFLTQFWAVILIREAHAKPKY